MADGGSDPAKHGERMTVVVSVFQSADHRGGGADPRSQLALTEARPGAELVDLASDMGIGNRLLVSSNLLWIVTDIAVVEVLQCIRSGELLHTHSLPRAKGVPVGVGLEPDHPLGGRAKIPLGDFPLLGQAVADDGGGAAVKEVENAIVDPVELDRVRASARRKPRGFSPGD